jgi:alpha-mannosidase
VTLSYDRAVASNDSTTSVGGFDNAGEALPAEMLPAHLAYNGVQFTLGPARTGALNAVTAHGQKVTLPVGKWTRVYVLAASADGDQNVTFRVGNDATDVVVEDWTGYVGQWDYRTMKRIPGPPPSAAQIAAQQRQQAQRDSVRKLRVDSVLKAGGDTSRIPAGRGRGNQGPRLIDAMDRLNPGFIKPASIAWYASHKHTAAGANEYYSYSYLFAYPIDVPAGATSITLPDNDKIRIMAVTAVNEPGRVVPAHPLHDTLGRTTP